MILSNLYFRQIRNAYEGVTDTRNRLVDKQSELDKKISEIYHEIEGKDIREIDQTELLLSLQDTLRKRRVVKGELRGVQSLHKSIQDVVISVESNLTRIKNKHEEVSGPLESRITIYDVF